jgi:hypothetical protein
MTVFWPCLLLVVEAVGSVFPGLTVGLLWWVDTTCVSLCLLLVCEGVDLLCLMDECRLGGCPWIMGRRGAVGVIAGSNLSRVISAAYFFRFVAQFPCAFIV